MEKDGRRRNTDESIGRDGDILWKTIILSIARSGTPIGRRAAPHSNSAAGRKDAPNERPVRGDNRTGQAILALGVDGRSRRIQPRWGGITAPTVSLSPTGRLTFKAAPRFFWLPFRTEVMACRDRWPACRRPWRGIGASGARVEGTSCCCWVFPGGRGSETAATGRGCAAPYGVAAATLTIFSPCSLRIRPAASSFDIALLPNCSRNMPPLVPMIAAR